MKKALNDQQYGASPFSPEEQAKFACLAERLPPWYRENARDLPWRHTRRPYAIWVSEVMLQQTRVEAVKGYYRRFLAALPTLSALAEAPEEKLMQLWQGLGYYSRARNLQKAAQQIVAEGGIFPREYAAIRALPGVGDYTADAVSSICFNSKTPAVDGNVMRLVCRILLLEETASDPKLRQAVREALRAVCPAEAGAFTQALMELGATVCLPSGKPACGVCPMKGDCRAHAVGQETAYPIRAEKKPRREEELTVFLLQLADGRTALRKRPESGLLSGLYELPNLPGVLPPQAALAQAEAWGTHPLRLISSRTCTHIFTHVEWHITCYRILCGEEGILTFRPAAEVPLPSAFSKLL